MTSQAISSQGTQLFIDQGGSPTVWTQIKDVNTFRLAGGERSEISVSNLDSTAKEFLLGLKDNGNLEITLSHVASDPGQSALRSALSLSTPSPFKLTFSDNTYLRFAGLVKSNSLSGGVDAKVDTSFSIRLSGDIEFH